MYLIRSWGSFSSWRQNRALNPKSSAMKCSYAWVHPQPQTGVCAHRYAPSEKTPSGLRCLWSSPRGGLHKRVCFFPIRISQIKVQQKQVCFCQIVISESCLFSTGRARSPGSSRPGRAARPFGEWLPSCCLERESSRHTIIYKLE